MRATPSLRCFASTMMRPPSSWVMCEVSSRVPSAMPTRSAPSSRALALIWLAVSGFLKISTKLPLLAFELLELARHHHLVALGPHPARIPLREPGDRLSGLARLAPVLLDRIFLRRAFGDLLLHVGEMGVIVVADRADGEAARAVAERADDAQQALPEAEQIARFQHGGALLRRSVDHALHELQHGHEAEFLRLGGAAALVDAPAKHRIWRTRVQAAAARFADADLLGDALIRLELELAQDAREVDARAELRREDVHFQPERAEAGFHAEMARRQATIGGALEIPIGFLRRGDEGRMSGALELVGQAVRDLVHLAQHQHVHVLHRHVGHGAEG